MPKNQWWYQLGPAFSKAFSDALTYPTLQTVSNTFTVTTGTTGRISFDHAGGDNQGYVIDNVRLVSNTTAAAPEPGSLALLGAGLLPMVGVLVRRRRR